MSNWTWEVTMRFRPMISVILLAAYLPACTAYHQTDESVVQLTAPPKPADRVRVTTVDGTRVQIWSPRVQGDSLFGKNAAPGKETGGVTVALADVRSVEVQKVDALKTFGGVLVVSAVIGLFFALAFHDTCVGYCP
jgi:hypothetical protein